MRAPVSILEAMIQSDNGKPIFWVTSLLDVGVRGDQVQVTLEPSEGRKYEPIPGLTAHVVELCEAGAFKAILGAASTQDQRVLYLSAAPVESTHTEVGQ